MPLLKKVSQQLWSDKVMANLSPFAECIKQLLLNHDMLWRLHNNLIKVDEQNLRKTKQSRVTMGIAII